MKNKKYIFFLIILFAIFLAYRYVYHNSTRHIEFKFVKCIQLELCDESDSIQSYFYIDNKQRLLYFLCEYDYYHRMFAYDNAFIDSLCKEFDFKSFDYIISPQYKISQLRYSPAINDKYYDGCEDFYNGKYVLEPIFVNSSEDSLYIYRINKTPDFIPPEP